MTDSAAPRPAREPTRPRGAQTRIAGVWRASAYCQAGLRLSAIFFPTSSRKLGGTTT